MTDYSRSRCYHGGHYDKYLDASDSNNTVERMQQRYWATKQAFYRKLGKKEDECIVASDAELDAKLELFKAIEESCTHLMRVLEAYQDKLCAMSHEENALGRFLKENGKQDKTRAGKMMIATGKTLSYTAQQRLALRVPLVRLYQEVETFQYRAITDTSTTVEKMEKTRTAYRGALMWMKDVSQQLDPDMYKQMEKFKKVQGHVRKTKTKFEKLKLDTLQKVDLLSASRCNMFSHALASYQNTLLQFWEKTANTMNTVAESFRGYQHYEFSMLKELTEPSKKLAEETAGQKEDEIEEGEEVDKDKLIFFESEYHDDDDLVPKDKKDDEKSASLQNLLNSPALNASSPASKKDTAAFKKNAERKSKCNEEPPLVNLGEETKTDSSTVNGDNAAKHTQISDVVKQTNGKISGVADLLTETTEVSDSEKDDMTILSEILSVPLGDIPLIPASNAEGSFSQQWQAAFGDKQTSPEELSAARLHSPSPGAPENGESMNRSRPTFFPSQLLEATMSSASNTRLNSQSNEQKSQQEVSSDSASRKKLPPLSSVQKKNKQKELSDWFNLFADLDPLANPDSVGKKNAADDHNC